MFHYLFTNDLRSSRLETVLKETSTFYIEGTVPSSQEDKARNNTATTLGFYFNLNRSSNCSAIAASGDIKRVILNFIKKFQFPNPRTSRYLRESRADNIQLAPMRTILKLLYIIYIQDNSDGYLTKEEIKEFIFYNNNVAKIGSPNLIEVYNQIKTFRDNSTLPDSIACESERVWNSEKRQLKEMLNILKSSGVVKEERNDSIEKNVYKIVYESRSTSFKAALFDILTYDDFWDEKINTYTEYMDIMESSSLEFSDESEVIPRNKIIFGAPGTGKSFSLNESIKKIIPCTLEEKANEEYFERVTFYPTYTYSQFVGCYKPKPKSYTDINRGGEHVTREYISYEFVPGPFTRILVKALKLKKEDSSENCMVLIEEINRANAAGVFGDIFQLLDRDIDGNSEYSINTSEEMRTFLASELEGSKDEYAKINIPSNLYIWATMNSADQGVTPMDTAFKRRWDFEYIGINKGEYKCPYLNKPVKIGEIITSWNKIRKEINRLLQTPNLKVGEDKLMGPFFLSKNAFVKYEESTLENSIELIDNTIFKAAFKSKVLMYLFEDVVKSKKSQLFESTTYSNLCEDFDSKGLSIFKNIVIENLIVKIAPENNETTPENNETTPENNETT